MKEISGTMFSYYFICKRKLWFYSQQIAMESSSELVEIGKMLHDETYSRSEHNILIDGICIDHIDKNVVCEVKKSRSCVESSMWQLKYYLYILYKKGIADLKGVLKIPTSKEKIDVEITRDDIIEIENICCNINKIITSCVVEAAIETKKCKNCAYYDLCFI